MGAWFSKTEFEVDGRTVLITGGSKGMGLSIGKQLAAKGANVVIVARGVQALEEGVKEIAQSAVSPSTQRFHHISADLIDSASATGVLADATAWNNGSPPDIVFCCAGSAHPTLFIDTPLPAFQHMMDSNYFSAVWIAHATLNAWLRPSNPSVSSPTTPDSTAKDDTPTATTATATKQPKQAALAPRHIIFTGSFLSFFTFAGFAPYSPSKAALRSLADSLANEVQLYAGAHPALPRVSVHTVFPATIFTASLEAENEMKTDLTHMLEEGDAGQTADQVARETIRGLERGEELVTTTFLTRLVRDGMWGGSRRGGLVRGTLETLLGWVVMVVMVFVRWDTDRKVFAWGRKHGASGKKVA